MEKGDGWWWLGELCGGSIYGHCKFVFEQLSKGGKFSLNSLPVG
jgi:hypothetical protein